MGYDLDEVYSFEFKKNNLKKLFVRWKAKLPYPLEVDFPRQMLKINYNNQDMIKVGPFGLFETKKKKVKVLDLSQ